MKTTYQQAIKQIKLYTMGTAGQIKTIFLRGKPGIGKTALVSDLAKEYEKKLKDEGKDVTVKVIKLRLTDLFAEDLAGIPQIDPVEKTAKWYAPEFLPTAGSNLGKDYGILFLDEVNRAKPDVLQAMMKILDRDNLSDRWIVVCAGNLGAQDGTNVEEFDTAQERRFAIFDLEFSLTEWCDWAEKYGIVREIIDFLRAHPMYAYYEYTDSVTGKKGYVTPANWHMLHNLYISNRSDNSLEDIVKTVGLCEIKDVAIPFLQYLAQRKKLGIEDILSLPKSDTAREKILQASYDELVALKEEVVSHFQNKGLTDITQEEVDAVDMFLGLVKDDGSSILPDDLRAAYYQEIKQQCRHLHSLLLTRSNNCHLHKTANAV